MAKKKTEKEAQLHIEIIKQMITLATSGFGLVAALAWNNVIQEFVKVYVSRWLPQGGGLASLLLYAVIITILAVFVTYQLSKLLKLQLEKQK
jgi:TRAP-type C4-dicarboxylate transport system permease small subunit